MIASVDNKEHNLDNAVDVSEVVENVSLEHVEKVENESSDEALTFEEKLEKNELKTIQVSDFTDTLKVEVTYVFQELEELAKEVIEKRTLSLEKSVFIRNKVDALVVSGNVQIDKDEYEKSEASVKKYADLLESIIHEIYNELSYFAQFLNETVPATIIVPKWETDSFTVHLAKKLKGVKKYIKDMKKDLNISYSRYCFGFEAQIRRIIYIESYLNSLAHGSKQGAAQQQENPQ